jgi:indole-3-glycerol phosphate synthase
MSEKNALDEILEATRLEVKRLRAAMSAGHANPKAPIDVVERLRRPAGAPLRIIAEIKHRSPSAGRLSTALSVSARARAYADGGASMISVLVDRSHFDGGYDQLAVARASVDTPTDALTDVSSTRVPILCKGFVIDEAQVEAAGRAGADAVLLIARILDDGPLKRLCRAVRSRGMTEVIEVVDECELERALAAQARVLGVNARDLATLGMDASRAQRVIDQLPDDRVALFFSGLGSAEDVAQVAAKGRSPREGRRIDGALVGEALMRLDDPEPLLRAMVAAAS